MSKGYLFETWQQLELAAHFVAEAVLGDRDLYLQAMIEDAEGIGNDTIDACVRLAKKHWRETPPFTSIWFSEAMEAVEESNV